MSEWQIDRSHHCGECDEDGWSYAPTLELLVDAMSQGKAFGQMNSISLVRRRRYTRSCICISHSIRNKISSRMDVLQEKHSQLEATLKSKRGEFISIKEYEIIRSSRCKNGYFMINNQISAYLSMIKEYRESLVNLGKFLKEVNEIESEYAHRMHRLGVNLLKSRPRLGERREPETAPYVASSSNSKVPSSKSYPGMNIKDTEAIAIESMNNEGIERFEDYHVQSTDESPRGEKIDDMKIIKSISRRMIRANQKARSQSNSPTEWKVVDGDNDPSKVLSTSSSSSFHEETDDSQAFSPSPTQSMPIPSTVAISSSFPSMLKAPIIPDVPCVDAFFERLGEASTLIGGHHAKISKMLNSDLINDVNKSVIDISNVYSQSKVGWKDVREAYRAIEDEISVAYTGVDISCQYSVAMLISELSQISAELGARKSGKGVKSEGEIKVDMEHRNKNYRKDVWSHIHQYNKALERIKVGLLALVQFEDGIKKEFERLTIRVKAIFLAVSQQLSNVQTAAWTSSADTLLKAVSRIVGSEFVDEEFLYENSSEEARGDVSTMEILLHYYTCKSQKSSTAQFIRFADLPTIPASNSISISGYLLHMPTTHACKPENFQLPNPDGVLHPLIHEPVEHGHKNTFVGEHKYWTIVKVVCNVPHFS